MLWLLHLAADAGIVVVDYVDDARGTMEETADGGGHFVEVVLRPTVTTTTEVEPARMDELHERAHALCYIAQSVNFPVRCEGRVRYRSSPR
jgi:organic hydroperoxide reductase OsmC/OhrA